MSRGRFRVVPAVYLALTRPGDHGTEVLLQLRAGTGYMDGWWACGAAGHVERGESALAAAVRECREELAAQVSPDDLRLLATLHRGCALDDPIEDRIDLFLEVTAWRGTPRLTETDKAAEVRWWPLAELPERMVPHERRALEHLRSGAAPALLTHGFAQSLTLVAAVGRNGVIGDGEAMPWHLPEDLAHFKGTTTGGVMVMGRGTWDSIGRALPGRRTVVVTRDPDWGAPGAEVAHSLPEALLMAGDQEVFVAGGGEIYAQTIVHADRLVITEVDQEPEGSVTFPRIDPDRWEALSREPREGFAWVEYRRRHADPAEIPAGSGPQA